MNDNQNDPLETLISGEHATSVPSDLRTAVLSQVDRQLRTCRWERRLTRATVLLLFIGIALNAKLGWEGEGHSAVNYAQNTTQEKLIEVGVSVAETTDVETGSQFVNHLAAFSGTNLTRAQASSIEKAIQERIGSKKAG
jgi:hypothetical protein